MLCVLGNMNGKIYTQIALSGRTHNAKCGSLKGEPEVEGDVNEKFLPQ